MDVIYEYELPLASELAECEIMINVLILEAGQMVLIVVNVDKLNCIPCEMAGFPKKFRLCETKEDVKNGIAVLGIAMHLP
jgi:hypothetical protein